MKRRNFMTLVGGAAVAWPFALCAQQSRRIPRIGYLMNRTAAGTFDESFLLGLRENGYIAGQNITIEYRWTGNKMEMLPPLARELVALNVDIIVTSGAEAVNAAKEATKSIPIVMTAAQDAVADGLVESLAHPGGNVTGRSVYAEELTSKRMELLKDVVPNLLRVGVMWNQHVAGSVSQLREAEKAGLALGVGVEPLSTQIPEGLDDAMAKAVQAGAGAILIISDSATITNRTEIGTAGLHHRLATIFSNKAYLVGGGLMSYGPDIADCFRLSATYVAEILKGAKPADLPVQQPTQFEFVINIKTAKALGLSLSPSLLARADSVIE
jgi:putative ABC transport system substrate-binding protein